MNKIKVGDTVNYFGPGMSPGNYIVLTADSSWDVVGLDRGKGRAVYWALLEYITLVNDVSALRFNTGKPELIYPDMFPAALEGVARVYMYGTQRPNNPYPRYNFTKPAPFTELYNCARRHMLKWFNGEENDEDAKASGFDVNHLDSAIGNLMRLRQQIVDHPDQDDRPKKT